MHRSYYTVPPTWPPLSPTPHPVCSQPHQVSRLAGPEVTASVLYSSVNDASFHACYNLHYQSLCHCHNFQSILLIFLVSQSHEEWLHETSFSLPKTLPLGQTQLCLVSCMHFRIPLAWCIYQECMMMSFLKNDVIMRSCAYTCNLKGTAHALCTSIGVCAIRGGIYAWSRLRLN